MVIWSHGSTPYTVSHLQLGGEVGFVFLGVDLSLSDVVMSWLRLQQASDCIPHPIWMYTKCFGALIWCEWSCGSNLTLLGLCRWGAYFGFLGVDLSMNE